MVAISSNGTGGGPWSDTDSWNGGVVPGEGDCATILNGDTITIDQDTTIGDDTATAALTIAAGGTLDWPSTVAADYTLTAKGNISVSGTFQIGSVANPLPKTRKATVKLNYSASLAAGKYGLLVNNGGTLILQGASDRIAVDRALLAADCGGTCSTTSAANSVVTRLQGTAFTGKSGTITINGTDYTVQSVEDADHLTLTGNAGAQTNTAFVFQSDNQGLTTDVATGWQDDDLIGVAATGQTFAACEQVRLNGAAVGTALTIDGGAGSNGGLNYGHLGTVGYQAELINLTRNVLVTSYSSTNPGYVVVEASAVVDGDWVECSYLGTNAANKYGITVNTTTGTFSLKHCSLHQPLYVLLYIGLDKLGWTVEDCVGYGGVNTKGPFLVSAGANGTLDNVWHLCSPFNACPNFQIETVLGTYTQLVAVGQSYSAGISLPARFAGTLSDCTVHSCVNGYSFGGTGVGANVASPASTPANLLAWACTVGYTGTLYGARLTNLSAYAVRDIVSPNTVMTGSVIDGGSWDASTWGVAVNSGCSCQLRLRNLVIGGSQALLYDVDTFGNGNHTGPVEIVFENCQTNSPTPVSNVIYMASGSSVRYQKYNQQAGDHRAYYALGTIQTDSVIFDVTPSVRATPNNATSKLEVPVGQVLVSSGETATVSINVRKSVVGDGAAYNGNQPRLVCKANIAAGVASDSVLASATDAANGAWETLTGVTPAITDDAALEIVVDCDGTAGWINCDTGSVV